MRARRNLTGQRFGYLVAVSMAGTGTFRRSMWFCKCDCGGDRTAYTAELVAGMVKSCGCSPRGARKGIKKHRRQPCECGNTEFTQGNRTCCMCGETGWRKNKGVEPRDKDDFKGYRANHAAESMFMSGIKYE